MTALLDAALAYAARGWHVFPCAPEAKHPITERGYKDATTDPEKIKAWWTQNPNANIGLNLEASGLVSIDADTYKPECEWKDVAAANYVPSTLVQRSARGGTHFIFRAELGARYVGSAGQDVDVKHKGYILLHPSRFDGGTYQFQNDAPIASAPDWLKRPEKTLAETVGNAQGSTGRTLAEVEEALRWVNPDMPYEPWVNVLMAIHDEFGPEGLTLAEEWSARAPHRYKEGVVEAKFASFSPGGGTTINTVFDLAKKAGADLGQLRAKHFDVGQFFQPASETSGAGAKTIFDIVAEQEREAEPEAQRLFPLLSIDDIINRPPPRWLIEDKVPQVGLGFLYSEPGVGKSFVALDMCLTIAAGMADWHGDSIDCDPDKPIVYIAAEGESGFRNRIKAWLQEHPEADRAAVARRLKVIPRTVDFMKPEDIKTLLASIEAAQCGKPAIVVVDTVSRAMPGADENLQKEMTIFVAACDRIRDVYGCVVLGIHHAGKSGDLRGSTVLLGAGDFVMRLTRKDKAASIVELSCEKSKDGADTWSASFRMAKTAILGDVRANGAPETSLVVQPLGAAVAAEVTRSGDDPKGGVMGLAPGLFEAILEAADAAWNAGEPWAGARARVDDDRKGVTRLVRDFKMERDFATSFLDGLVTSGVLAIDRTPRGGKADRKQGYRVLRRDFGGGNCKPDCMSGGTDVFG